MTRIYQHEAARHDLVEHFVYLAENASLETAERFLSQAEAAFLELAEHPLIGAPLTLQNPALAGMRKWRIKDFDNHLIVYLPHNDDIAIVRVLHAARDWWNLLGVQGGVVAGGLAFEVAAIGIAHVPVGDLPGEVDQRNVSAEAIAGEHFPGGIALVDVVEVGRIVLEGGRADAAAEVEAAAAAKAGAVEVTASRPSSTAVVFFMRIPLRQRGVIHALAMGFARAKS